MWGVRKPAEGRVDATAAAYRDGYEDGVRAARIHMRHAVLYAVLTGSQETVEHMTALSDRLDSLT